MHNIEQAKKTTHSIWFTVYMFLQIALTEESTLYIQLYIRSTALD